MFAFAYYAWSMDEKKSYPRLGKDPDSYLTTFKTEVRNLISFVYEPNMSINFTVCNM